MRCRRYQITAAAVIAHLAALAMIVVGQTPPTDTQRRAVNTVHAQSCTLKLAQAPELRSFRLGMSTEQVVARFLGLRINSADDTGRAQIYLRFFGEKSEALSVPAAPSLRGSSNRDVMNDQYSGTAELNRASFPGFDDVKSVRLLFLDGRIYSINVEYKDDVQWSSIDEFAARVSEALNLSGSWEAGTKLVDYMPMNTRTISCAEFKVIALMNSVSNDSPSLVLEDLATAPTIEARLKEKQKKQRQKEDERRRVFKPKW